MSKLEEVKSQFSWGLSNLQSGSMNLDDKDVDYLFQHIEELQAKVEELEKEKDEWKDTAQSYYVTNQELREKNKRYKQALEFYADEDNYKPDVISQWEPVVPVMDDNGEQARQALKEREE